MTIRRYAYGLAAAALLTGGAALYYLPAAPGLYVTADDVAELLEGINERRAALAATPHSGDSNGWSFSTFTNLPNQPTHAQMQAVLDEVEALAPSYLQSYTSTSATPWTVSNLFIAAGVGPGDGRPLWTVGWTGAPVYGAEVGLYVMTNTLWEAFRALRLMSNCLGHTELEGGRLWGDAGSYLAYNPEPLVPTNWGVPGQRDDLLFYGLPGISYWFFHSEGPGLFTNPPAWYASNNLDLLSGYTPARKTAAFDVAYTTAPVSVAAGLIASELTVYRARSGLRLLFFDEGDGYRRGALVEASGLGASAIERRSATNIVPVFHMATGAVCTIYLSIATTGGISSAQDAFAPTNFAYFTGSVYSVTATGVATGYLARLAFDGADTPLIQELLDLPAFVGGTNDVITARSRTVLPRPPVMQWQFTRCRP